MNFLRKNQGYTGVDISISILVLVILIPIIGGIVYNISKAGNGLSQKSYAINVATNILEIAKSIDDIKYVYSKTDEEPEESETKSFIYFLNNRIQSKISDAQIQTVDGDEHIVLTVQDQKHNHYRAIIDVVDFADVTSSPDPKNNIVKEVKANVTYSVGSKLKNVEISTVVSKR